MILQQSAAQKNWRSTCISEAVCGFAYCVSAWIEADSPCEQFWRREQAFEAAGVAELNCLDMHGSWAGAHGL
jgi:hypothetical protein